MQPFDEAATMGPDLADIAALAQSAVLNDLPLKDVGTLLGELTRVRAARGTVITESEGFEPALYFVLSGKLELRHFDGRRAILERGHTFGERTLAGTAVDPAQVTVIEDASLARLGKQRFRQLATEHAQVALHLSQRLASRLAEELDELERASLTNSKVHAAAMTPVDAAAPEPPRLPAEVAGALVVAARDGERLLSLRAAASSQAQLTPLTTRQWEGRDIYRTSAGLVLLEAARQLGHSIRLGPSITSGRLVFPRRNEDARSVVDALNQRMAALIESRIVIEEELWPVPKALEVFRQQDDENACLLLADWLEPVVTLVRCGSTWGIGPGPLLPHAGLLQDIRVLAHPLGLLLDFGPRIREELPRRPTATMALELRAPRYGSPMTRREAEWLALLGVESVGTFNRACVEGKVTELIHVSEGFHEKRIAEIADEIKGRPSLRIVAVAGPSSSGKTTFIKRLLVQLRVNGIEPLELSLDDYYLDRDRQARDERGELDFEILRALDLPLLQAHLAALLSGSAVHPPRYDFHLGRSLHEAGAELRLREGRVLLLEGIHALNPELYGMATRAGTAFKIFIHPATSLPFDRLSSLEPADVRLLRRLVRDRHQRGFAAEETLARWSSVRRGERLHIFPFQAEADAVFDSSLIYEVSVLRVYAERYLLEVPRTSAAAGGARRLRKLLQLFAPIHPDHVPPTSILREFIGGSGFSY